MNKSKVNKSIVLRAFAVLFVLVMLSFNLLSGLYARYASSASGSDTTSIALFKVEAGEEYYSDSFTFDSIAPGSSQEFTFKIKSESEVSISCAASVETTGNLPLTYTITQNDVEVPLDNIYTFTPEEGEVSFKLVVSWDESVTDIKYKDEIDVARMTINATQVD